MIAVGVGISYIPSRHAYLHNYCTTQRPSQHTNHNTSSCRCSIVSVFFCYRILLLSYSFVIVFFSYRILLLSYSFVIVFFCYRILLLSYSFVLAFFCYDSVTPCRCHSYCTTLYIPDIRRCSFVTPIFCSHTIVIQRMHLKHSDG